jgi:acetoin utilization protein AcuB
MTKETRTMKIESWMKHPVVSVKPRDSRLSARQLMEEHRFNQLPVVRDGEVVGIVTDRDLRDAFPSVLDVLRRRTARPGATDPARIPVEDVMSRNLVSLGPHARVVDAALLMRRERIGAIPIVDRGRLVGILTRSDVLDAFAELAGAADATS